MANTKISALTSATTPLAGTEVLPIVQSSTTTKVAVNDMLSVTSWTSPAVDSNGNMFLRATDAFATGVGTQIGLGGKYNTTSYYPFGAISGRKENATGNNVAGYLSLLTTTTGGTLTERWRVDSTGNFVQKVAGYGINFTANTPASGMTSQLLNWYEEGTWTPAMVAGTSGTITTGSVGGKYTRVGRQVTATGYIDAASVSTPIGALTITGLPFACGSGLGSRTAAVIYPSGLSATAVTSVIGRVISGESQIRVDKYSAGTISNLAGDVVASTSFHFSVTYFV